MALSEINPATQTITFVPNNQGAWNEAVKIGNTPANAVWDDCKMTYPYISVYYDEHYYHFDGYNQHGYVGRMGKAKRVLRASNPLIYTGKYERLPANPL